MLLSPGGHLLSLSLLPPRHSLAAPAGRWGLAQPVEVNGVGPALRVHRQSRRTAQVNMPLLLLPLKILRRRVRREVYLCTSQSMKSRGRIYPHSCQF